MRRLRNIVLAGIFGAVILFVWNSFSWMVLPWHAQILHQFANESVVSKVIKDNVNKSGIYLSEYNTQSLDNSPQVFSVVSFHTKGGMQAQLMIYFVIEAIAAFLVAFMVILLNSKYYFVRLGFILLFALTAAIFCQLPYWIWWHFPSNFILVTFLDTLIAWFLAGTLMAAILTPKKSLDISNDQITIQR